MNKHFEALELPKILERLAGFTACPDAREAALALSPKNEYFEAQSLLDQTEAAHTLIAKFGAPSFGGLKNVQNSLHRAQAGGTLSMRELLDIAQVLRVIRGICTWRDKSAGLETAIDDLFFSLSPNKYLEDRITNAILSDDEMSDNASPDLKNIRRKMRQQDAKIRDQLEKLLRSPTYKNSLQEAIVTQRNGRFVVPVKSEHRAEVAGMVHDTSGSGSTVFIEPASVVEANNEIKVLESRERDEIERILTELSEEAGSFYDSVRISYQSAVELNLIFAKAQLAYSMKAGKPVLNAVGEIELKQARHPLIAAEKVVPVDIRLGAEFDALVITGPNTGGKTVSIKTLGLLTLMAACGLYVPAADNSRVAVFRHVFADIGEEQSIEQSLSTFSAHMKNIVAIDKETDDSTLVLIDELGAGTDPVEGAALAVSILEALRKKGAKIAATTHYSELKEYALNTERVENASCEFSVETLRPTYKLLIGIPGRSNAFAISERLGISPDIIDNARKLVSSENQRFEDVVDTLEQTRAEMEHEKQKTLELQGEVDALRKKAEQQVEDAKKKSDRELERAKQEAQRIVENARRAANSLILEVERLKKEQAREKNAAEMARKAKAAMKRQLNDLDDLTAERLGEEDDGDYVLPRPLTIGDTVYVTVLGTNGTVTALPDSKDNVEIQAGSMKMKVPLQSLRLRNSPKKNTPQRTAVTRSDRGPSTSKTSVDLRGKNAEEALLDLDMFLDGALRAGLSEVTVVHGKGTGVLRKAVQAHLRKLPFVRSFRLGVYGEGEDGVTIVEFK
ncbi:MAG TPA: endonuclease MutS2 [Candidatus Fimenecus excrementavium]|nr:endonuclease MutS2 [Candidatus Fimenecus excrementavium]